MLTARRRSALSVGTGIELIDEERERRENSIYPAPQDFADSGAYQKALILCAVERAKRLLDRQLGPVPKIIPSDNPQPDAEKGKKHPAKKRGRKRDTNPKADEKRVEDWRDWRKQNPGGTEKQFCVLREIDLGEFHRAKKRVEGRERYAEKFRQ